jgi:hypothetical protein
MTDQQIRSMFAGASDFEPRALRTGEATLYAYFIDGLVSGSFVADYIYKPIVQDLPLNMVEAYNTALRGGIYNAVARPCRDLQDVAIKLVNGFCVILFPGVGAIAFEARTGVSRGPQSPDVENTVKGPKDAFVETIRINTSLIRRHLRTPDLRISGTTVGRRSLTNVAVVWIEGITNPDLVTRMNNRLGQIDVDSFLSPSAVEEYVTGSRATAFPLLQYTERPDRFAQGLLDGRVGLLVDGLPLAYLVPVDIGYLMESPEDRSRDYISASCVRVLRYGALLLSLLLPAVYIALVMHHQQWIPVKLINTILKDSHLRPFTTATEVLGLLIAYELIQEAGIHLPQTIGQSVSMIGGIVVGTAAVEAGLIAPMVLIAVSLTGICGFVLPNRDLANAVRVWRFGISLLSMLLGMWGAGIGVAVLLLHLASIKSLGMPYLIPTPAGRGILRKRLINQKHRDINLGTRDRNNQK